MIGFVNAKLNLGLNIVSKRDDGYHNLETIFFPIGLNDNIVDNNNKLCDIIEIFPAIDGKEELIITGNSIDCPLDKNLVWRAYKAFCDATTCEIPPLKIILDKHLPDGAGMGGGSADASFTLSLLNKYFDNILSSDELKQIALSLGADCPFFLYNKPCYASGIGEIIQPIELDLSGYWIAIVKPQVSISTKEAFSMITPQKPNINLKEIAKEPIEKWKNLMQNDFEKSMFSLHPEIRNIKDNLYKHGAIFASMTGSGSAFFGIFKNEESATDAIINSECEFKSIIKL